MIGKVLLVPAVAGLTLLTAPAAHAAIVAAGCRAAAGAAAGYAVFDDEGTHTLRCYVTVNGAERATTPTGHGAGVVVTAGPVTYAAPDGAAVAICTEVDGVTTSCVPLLDPVRLVQDTTEPLCEVDACVWPPWYEQTLDPIVCPLLASASPGVPGVVDVTAQGDTTVVGLGPLWDCPPYGDLSGSR